MLRRWLGRRSLTSRLPNRIGEVVRLLLRELMADRPWLVRSALAVRWLWWLAAGCPLAAVGWFLVIGLGGSLMAAMIVGVVIAGAHLAFERVVPRVRTWRLGCRFRRRWPSVWLATIAGRWSAKPAGRELLAAPGLGWFPSAGSTWVSWSVRLRAGSSMQDLVEVADRLAAADRRVERVEVEWRRPTDSVGWLTVSFVDGLEQVEAPQWA